MVALISFQICIFFQMQTEINAFPNVNKSKAEVLTSRFVHSFIQWACYDHLLRAQQTRKKKKKKSHREKILQALLCAITWPWTSSKWLSKRHVKSTRTDQTLDWFPHPSPKPAPPPVFPISENSDFIFLVVQAQNSADSLHSILYHTPSIYFESKLSVLPSTYVPNLTISYHPYF